MSNLDFTAIVEKAKTNIQNLEGCEGPHTFYPNVRTPSGLVTDFICPKCGGVIDTRYRYWYEQGLKHGIKAGGQHNE